MEYTTKAYRQREFSTNLNINIRLFKDIFKNDAILRNRTVEIGKTGFRASVFYMDGMVNTEILNESVIKPLILANIRPSEISVENIEAKILFAGEVSKTVTLDQSIRGVLYSDPLLTI